MAQIIDGKKVSNEIKQKLKQQVDEFYQKYDCKPGLATVLVGEDPASQVYIKNKIKSCEACGMQSFHYNLSKEITEQQLLQKVHELNQDPNVNGILVQLPLPQHINNQKILEAILPQKDVDGFHPENIGRLMIGQDCLKSCTPFGVMKLLEYYNISLSGKDVVIIGRSNIVGKPISLMMLAENATITITHSRTKDLSEKVQRADVVVAAIGQPEFVKGSWIKKGAVVIDVGINRKKDKSLCGDVEFIEASQNASYITPVPGGVGPMTIATLLTNTLQAAQKQKEHKD